MSWSQEAEDLVLDKYFGHRISGFYVDVGAHHPERFSNTRLFYLRGWKGINIDAMPGSMAAFARERPRDINLELGISSTSGVLTYYCYDEPALNSFVRSEATVRPNNKGRRYRLIGTEQVPVRPLVEVLDKHLPGGQNIDFLSVDAERLDPAVLRSNDWDKYRPECVVVELPNFCVETASHDESYLFLRSLGYRVYAKTGNSVIFCPE